MLPQIKYNRQRFIKYAIKNGVTKASIRYKINRKSIYKWLKRYNRTLESLEDLNSKTSSKKHTEKNFNYTRSYGGLKSF